MFPFSTKNSLTSGVKREKLNLKKILGNLLDKLRKLYMSGTVIKKFLAFLKPAIENSWQFLLFRTDIFQKTVLGCPWLISQIVSYQLSLQHKWDFLPSCPFGVVTRSYARVSRERWRECEGRVLSRTFITVHLHGTFVARKIVIN